MPAKRRKPKQSLISGHLSGIKRALLEGEKRPVFLAFLEEHLPAKQGIYALYDSKGRLHYAGKASDLGRRLNQHLRDHHGNSWDSMTLFHVVNSADVAVLEGLVVATARPPGNKQRPKVGTDLRRKLGQYLKEDARLQIEQAVYPERTKKTRDPLGRHLTMKKLRSVSQQRLGAVLGLSQARVSHLFKEGRIRTYIRESGKRDAVLLMLEKARKP